MEFAIEKVVSWFPTVLACLCYCYFISSIIPKGFFRLFSLLPIFYLFIILPLNIPSVIITATSTLFLISLINSNPVPLGSSSNSIETEPNRTPDHSSQPPKPAKKLPFLSYIGLELVLLAVLIGVVLSYRDKYHPKILLVLYCCLVLLSVDCIGGASNFLSYAIIGLELELPSNKPYLSTSLQDFWGKRWNLRVTNALRRTIYNPVRTVYAVLLGKSLARLVAVLTTFLVSGLFHELFFYYLTRAKPTWEMTSFFVLHGFCVALEVAVKKGLKREWSLSRWISGPLTIGFVMLTSFWLFFPPLTRSSVDTVVLEEFRTFGELVHN
ncbi:OLC1v1022607C1 [Oldenlandia corymbosa var. corymbosa]|uniref:OLC1v1022607C1 n=1 Tax=Oldenlandia corymbosa var. corymbosa TaxID=529605 RepID=A0AAV1C1W7_OLDCO|nr:OLC1v1022607C1 [Oldenlandia corymbosa var. corymbosa]